MKKLILLFAAAGLLIGCEQKIETPPPSETKVEKNTTIVNPPAEKKTENTTVINPPAKREEKTTTTTTTQ